MLNRLVRSLVTFGVVLVAYQLYALFAVPRIEPRVAQRASAAATEDQWAQGSTAVGRYQRLLSSYFPPGHWSLTGSPKVIESGSVMLVLEDYTTDDQGRVDLSKCAVVTYPTPRVPGAKPPADAIILEAPSGAQLRFDEAFNPARGQIGRLVEGYFPGELVVRSNMEKPGPEDDLLIVTRDLRFRESIFLTDAEVRFRFGPHQGAGRKLEARLIMERHAKPGAEGPMFAGVSSLELLEQVQAEIALPKGTGNAAGPLRLTSQGPFRFDFTNFVASFQHHVRATIPQPTGPSDQLLCSELLLRFSGGEGAPMELSPEDEPDLARRQGRMLGDLEPYLVEATGNPVRVDSAVKRVAMRGRRVRVWLGDQRFRIEGAPASLAYGHNEVQSAWIDYHSPPQGSPQALGMLSVAGPGWMRAAPREEEPDRLIETRWGAVSGSEEAVRLDRDRRGEPVLRIKGNPEVAATGLGKIRSKQLVVRLREVAPDGPDGPAIEFSSPGQEEASNKLAVIVERIDALGSVRFQGRELEGATENLVAWFRPIEGEQASGGSPFGGGPTNDNRAPDKTYRLAAGEVQLEVGLFGRRATPTGLICHRGVRFEEVARHGVNNPLRVSGEELRINDLHREHARLTVSGATEGHEPANQSTRKGLAQIEAQGVKLWASDLHIDQAASRVWSEGPGDARVRLDERSAAAAGLTGEATLRWKGGLEFDGQQIRVHDEVFGEVSSGWLHCTELNAWLSQPIDLRNSNTGSLARDVEIAQVECLGGVTIDQRTSDDQGQIAHDRVWIGTLKVNQQSGAISGEGPGWIRSVRLTDGEDGLAKLTGQGDPQAVSAPKLRFLRVNFQRGLTGNINDRAVQFHERVRGVYGPVLAWEHDLPVEPPEGLPPDVVGLACEELRVNEDPAGRFSAGAANGGIGPLEVRALGRVRLEGMTGDRGASFTAEAASASYTQLKEVFVLEGNASRNATLWIRQDATSEPARTVARKISYDRRTGRVKAEDIRGVDYQAGGGQGIPPRR